jgi:drug/metabolite transporter (DMT)-like permease
MNIQAKSALKKIAPYLIVTIAPLCWAGNVVLARGVIHMIPPIGLAFWRWTIAFLILLPFSFSHARRDWPLVVRNWRILFLISVLGISCFNTLLYKAVHTISAINVSLIQTTMPAFIILISLVLFNQRVRAVQTIGVGFCILGAVLVILRGNLIAISHMSFSDGDLLMIIAVIIYAFYTVLLRKRPGLHPFSLLTYTFGIGILGLLPAYVWEIVTFGGFEFTFPVFLSILYVAVFPSVVAYFCWNRGVDELGASKTGLFINLIPVFASILAILFLGESLKVYHVVGMVFIFSGMVLFHRQPKKRSNQNEEKPS